MQNYLVVEGEYRFPVSNVQFSTIHQRTQKSVNREIFGPVICVYPYDDLQQAIEQANNLPFAFQSSVFTRDIDEAMHIGSRLHASAVMINDHTAFRVDWMPFAGLKQSGLGTGGIPYTMNDMQIDKMTVLRTKALH